MARVGAFFASVLLGLAQAAPSSSTHALSSRQAAPGLERCNNPTFDAVLAKYGGSLVTYNSTDEPYPDAAKVLYWANAALGIPDICGVRVAVTGNIAFEMYLPTTARWNRRFLTVGNGGFAGGTSRYDMFSRAVHGWAVMSTNVGHEDASGSLAWGAGNQSLQIDWAWRAMAKSVPFAKELVAAYYQDVTSVGNYYSGCSTGGRQGIRQIEVDPDSFDGMLVGAPAWNVRSAMPVISRIGWLGQTYGLRIGGIDDTLLQRIYDRLYERCNVLGFDNTADDGVIRDSDACLALFRNITGPAWSNLDCQNNTPGPNCVSFSQRQAFITLLDEFRVPPQNQTYAGDGFDITAIKDLSTFLAADNLMAPGFDQEFSTHFLNETIVWDSDFNGSRLINRSNEWDAEVRANANPALLQGWKGKTILYTGTADGTVSSLGTRRAFEMAGGAGNENLAYFELPGMPHCVDNGLGRGGDRPPWYIGGTGVPSVYPFNQWYMPNNTNPPLNNSQHDALIALTEWVEQPGRTAPTQLVATAFDNWGPGLTVAKRRTICAVPMRQNYTGGDVNAPESWGCVPE